MASQPCPRAWFFNTLAPFSPCKWCSANSTSSSGQPSEVSAASAFGPHVVMFWKSTDMVGSSFACRLAAPTPGASNTRSSSASS